MNSGVSIHELSNVLHELYKFNRSESVVTYHHCYLILNPIISVIQTQLFGVLCQWTNCLMSTAQFYST